MIHFKVLNKYASLPSDRFVQVQRKGQPYDIGGKLVELFRVKVMAEALGRTSEIVKDWTKAGRFPRPLYNVESEQCKFWYSSFQIINCHRLLVSKHDGKKHLSKAALDLFFEEARLVWYVQDVTVNERGELNTQVA